jgi:hypothetical protein
MQTMREAWTDERLDDLNAKVDRGFERVDTDIRELRGEMNARFERLEGSIDARFDKVDARFDKVDARFDQLLRILLGFAGVLIAGLFLAIVGFFFGAPGG